jgi:hypothetical protein
MAFPGRIESGWPSQAGGTIFFGQLTDKWGDDRVMFFASQTDQGVEVINVAVGVGHQVLWSHLQFHLDSLA